MVDFHAEATSEKIAFGRFLDGKVSAVVGTHTHVATADEQIFPLGTAYQTDVGMCGAHDSVIGREPEGVIKRYLTLLPQRWYLSERDIRINGAFIEVDESSGLAKHVERVMFQDESSLQSSA